MHESTSILSARENTEKLQFHLAQILQNLVYNRHRCISCSIHSTHDVTQNTNWQVRESLERFSTPTSNHSMLSYTHCDCLWNLYQTPKPAGGDPEFERAHQTVPRRART